MSGLNGWQSELLVATKRYPIVFVHLGRAHCAEGSDPLKFLGSSVSVTECLVKNQLTPAEPPWEQAC